MNSRLGQEQPQGNAGLRQIIVLVAVGAALSVLSAGCGLGTKCSMAPDPKTICECDPPALDNIADPHMCCQKGIGTRPECHLPRDPSQPNVQMCIYRGQAFVVILDGMLHVVGEFHGEGILDENEPFTVQWTQANLGNLRSKSSDELFLTPILLVTQDPSDTEPLPPQMFPFKISALDPCRSEIKQQRFAGGLPHGSFRFTLEGVPAFVEIRSTKAIGI